MITDRETKLMKKRNQKVKEITRSLDRKFDYLQSQLELIRKDLRILRKKVEKMEREIL